MKVTEARTSHAQDSYRIVRVNFRPARHWWWDDVTVVSFALGLSLLWLGLAVAFAGRL